MNDLNRQLMTVSELQLTKIGTYFCNGRTGRVFNERVKNRQCGTAYDWTLGSVRRTVFMETVLAKLHALWTGNGSGRLRAYGHHSITNAAHTQF